MSDLNIFLSVIVGIIFVGLAMDFFDANKNKNDLVKKKNWDRRWK